jgi:hypothetical protein
VSRIALKHFQRVSFILSLLSNGDTTYFQLWQAFDNFKCGKSSVLSMNVELLESQYRNVRVNLSPRIVNKLFLVVVTRTLPALSRPLAT